jgi:ketosteroid isomerase-like protein
VRLALIQDVNGVVAELSAPAAKPAASTAPAPTIVAANRPVAPAASPVPQTVPAPAAANPIPAKTAPATSIAQTGTSPTPAPPPAVAVKAQAKPDAQPGPAPLPTPVKPTEPRKDSDKAEEEQVLKTVRGWAEAWSEKRVAVYLGYYARTFKPPGLSRKDWEAQRRERIAGARQIEVKLVNPRVHIEGETATVRFLQRYNSDKTEKSTAKTLILRRQGERWLITEERVG